MTVHAAHPRCAGCNRALYKSMEKGAKVRPEDPYAFCRNSVCEQYGYRGSEESEPAASEPEAEPEAEEEPEPANEVPEPPAAPPPLAPEGARRHKRSRPAGEAPPPPPRVDVAEETTIKDTIVEPEESEGEPVAVAMARARIRAILEKVTPGHSAAAIGLSLAILNQELGCHAGANALIEEFGLDRFGLVRFTTEGEPEEAPAE